MKAGFAVALMLGLAAVTACQEKLAAPTDCPELCPGTGLQIRDTTLHARLGLDSTYVGYLSANQVGALLVSNGIVAGEARTYAVLPARPDSVPVDGVNQSYTIDSVGIVVNLVARDTAVNDLRLIFHRIPIAVDTLSSFAAIDAMLTPESVIDSAIVHDTLRSGAVRVIVKGDALARILPSEADTGQLGIGIRLNAGAPTGVRLGSTNGVAGPPFFTTWVHANVTDTAKQRREITQAALRSNYVMDGPPAPGPAELFLGGRSGSRVLLRFELPPLIRDSGAVIRATLELTPVGPLKGLANDPAQLQIRGVLVDLGAKSPPLGGVVATTALIAGTTTVLSIDIRGVVTTWFGPNGVTPTMVLGVAPDGGTFFRPQFFSTLAASGAPRLRLTYALPTRPGHP